MDMYQKRKMRKENKTNNTENVEYNINWYITCYDKLLTNPYK